MKRLIRSCLVICWTVNVVFAADTEPVKQMKLTTDVQKFSYAMGQDVAMALKKKLKTDIDREAFMKGVEDSFLEKTPLISADEATRVKLKIAKEKRIEQEAQLKLIADRNLAEGNKFLEGKKKEKGATTTQTGLVYEVLADTEGERPHPYDRVHLNYRAMKLDGREYDSTYKTGQPITVPVNAVLPGWSEGLQLMTVGSRYRFFMPPHLAYGSKSAGPNGIIQPNETLIFEVELLGIEKAKLPQ